MLKSDKISQNTDFELIRMTSNLKVTCNIVRPIMQLAALFINTMHSISPSLVHAPMASVLHTHGNVPLNPNPHSEKMQSDVDHLCLS